MGAPRPWSYEVHELSEGYSGIVYDASGHRVGTDHLSEEDAAVIAAAPDLLEALTELVLYHDVPDSAQDPVVKPLLRAAFAAIAKASPQPVPVLDQVREGEG